VRSTYYNHTGGGGARRRRNTTKEGSSRPTIGGTDLEQHGMQFPCRGTSPSTNYRRSSKTGKYYEGGGDDAGGTLLYSENNVAALKGYCGVLTHTGIPKIWDAFQQTKELASHCHNLRIGMQRWSKQKGLDVDKAPFFTKNSIKDMVGLKFNPGEAVPTFSSAQQGISILTCRPESAQEVEQIKDFEEARRATAHTAQFKEVWRKQKMQPSPPLDTYYKLR